MMPNTQQYTRSFFLRNGLSRIAAIVGLCLFVLTVLAPTIAKAQTLRTQAVISDLERPVAITHAGDGSGRLFVTLQRGRVVIHDGTRVLPTPFLDITQLVSCCGERGLLSVAFHPNFTNNGFFFVNYTGSQGETVIARYKVSDNPDVADPLSRVTIMTIEQPFANHNGGQIKFGPDGFLYIGTGDGGSGGDPGNRSQSLQTLLGKMLRINIDGDAPYSIPPNNPFIGVSGARPEIWAYGLRNPWRFSFDRQTNNMFIADVGQDKREEVHLQPAESRGGENYGWRLMEGSICFNPPKNCNDGTLKLPILEYEHPIGCSITGGYVYRGSRIPELVGTYIYGDYCSGRIWGARSADGNTWTPKEIHKVNFQISTFGEDEVGEIYIADHMGGTIHRIVGFGS
jgi:glucose/arabinose dehydrogenase